jgi:hypothetical protein
MRELSETRYVAAADGVELAYRTVGDGPADLLWSFNQLNDVEAITEHEPILEYFDGLAEIARVIVHSIPRQCRCWRRDLRRRRREAS